MNTRKTKSQARPGGDDGQLEQVGGVVEGAMARRSTSSRAGVAGPMRAETG
jgi:hypothetical protein